MRIFLKRSRSLYNKFRAANIARLFPSRSTRAALVDAACFSEVVALVGRDTNERSRG